jgi:hypothetical protein
MTSPTNPTDGSELPICSYCDGQGGTDGYDQNGEPTHRKATCQKCGGTGEINSPNPSPELTEVERVARAIASKQFVGVEWQDLAGHQRDLLWRESQAAIQALSSKNELPSELVRAADAWDAHCLAVERCNAAIPDLEATKAERAVYDERYRASEQAKRDMYGVAFELAKWASQQRAALNPKDTGQEELERENEWYRQREIDAEEDWRRRCEEERGQ